MKALLFSSAAICAFFSLLVSPAHAQPGSLDATFNPGSGPNATVYCMALETNGQILIGGNFTTFNGANQHYVARLNADGSLDSSFYPGLGAVGGISYPDAPLLDALAVETNGEILIGGGFSGWNGLSWNEPICLRTDGSVDTSFNTSAANGLGVPYANGYGLGSAAPSGTVLAIAVQGDGKVVIGGGFTQVMVGPYNLTNISGIARLNTNGTLDASFNLGGGANGSVNALGLQSNGQIIIGGAFTSINNSNLYGLARLNTDGTVDGTFNALIQDGSVQRLVVTPQDQILIGGNFTSINGYSRNYIARLRADGSVDTSFKPGLGLNGSVTGMALQPNGEVIISGGFTSFNAVSVAGGLALLNTNGTLDTSFNPGAGPNATCVIVASQPDGRILIAGNFTSVNGTNINRIARLNGNGSTTVNLLNPQLYFGMNLTGVVSKTYQIQWTTNLNTPSLWTPLFDLTLQASPQFILDSNGATGTRFYRAVLVAP